MFRKKCKRCEREVDKKFEFCPYCGNNIKKEQDEKDFGFLGKNDDFFHPEKIGFGLPLGFNKIFNSLINQIDKQFRELDKQIGQEKKELFPAKKPNIKTNAFSISISTGTGKIPEIKISGFGPEFEKVSKFPEKQQIKTKSPEITEEQAKKLAKLPRQEAETQVRRLSNKLIYELKLPNVKSKTDIIVQKLENSVEIKAFSKDKIYFKLIPLKLPLIGSKFSDEILTIEFAER